MTFSDKIEPGVFNRTIRDDPALLFDHDARPLAACSKCHRLTWNEAPGEPCGMAHGGLPCHGTLEHHGL